MNAGFMPNAPDFRVWVTSDSGRIALQNAPSDMARLRAAFYAGKVFTERAAAVDMRPSFEHYKGGIYRYCGEAVRECDGVRMAIYESVDKKVYVRPHSEFDEKFKQYYYSGGIANGPL